MHLRGSGLHPRLALLLHVGMAIVLWATPAAAQSASAPPPRAEVREGAQELMTTWEYRFGDSPRDESGTLTWAQQSANPDGWRTLPGTAIPRPTGRDGQRFLWLRTRLTNPESPQLPELHDPTLYLELVNQLFEAYLDGQLIYRFGKLDGPGEDARRFLGYPVHFIRLGEDYAGRKLTLRIYSEHFNIGIGSQPRIGSKARLIRDLMRKDSGKTVVGSILSAIGLFVLGLYLTQRREYSYLYYGGFTFTMGLWLLCQIKGRSLIIELPLLWTYVEIFALYTTAACLALFMTQVLGRGPWGLMRLSAWLLCAYDVAAALLVALGAVSVMRTLWPFEVLLLGIIVYSLLTIGLRMRQGNVEAWIFAGGFICAMTFAVYDLVAALGIVPRADPPLSHFGQGAFALTLGFILMRRFRLVHLDLLQMRAALSEQVRALEARNAEIENLNVELRHQIEARSRQLVTSLIGSKSSSGNSSGENEGASLFADGDLINQRYRVLRLIGQGAMGVVYEVERVYDGRRFAAKVLSGRARRRELARFAREAQLLARLIHPNLVAIADVELTDSRLAYIIMELVHGKTLDAHHARYTELKFALPVLRQLAEALAAVHAQGIVHRENREPKSAGELSA